MANGHSFQVSTRVHQESTSYRCFGSSRLRLLQPIRETEEGRGNLRAALTGMQAELDALSSTWTSLKDPWPVRRAAADEKVHHCWFIEDLR